MLTRIVLLAALVAPMASLAQTLDVVSGTGDSVRISLSPSEVRNEGSSLSRQWLVINDPALPLQVERGQVVPKYLSSRRTYFYSANADLKTSGAAISAYDLRFLVLDAFGNRQQLLSLSRLVDVAAGTSLPVSEMWDALPSTDASISLYTITYVAAVRTTDGRVHRARLPAVLAEIQKISSTIQAADIEREKPAPTP